MAVARNDAPVTPTAAQPALRELFESLVELDPRARAERLASLALDAATRAALEGLLRADVRPAALLDVPPAVLAGRWRDSDDAADFVGTQVGPFRVVEPLGQGGSSVVFRAERDVGGARQVVALKLLRTGLFSPDARRRFLREQAILAQLRHPNIARLVDGGVTDAGIPYIALELVEGAPLTAHAEARALPLRARLELMLSLCRAVEYAHAALVVHRDLKPSNVHVDDHGAIKVLDFGTARLLDDELGFTRTEAIVLTPAYAAPEQFRSGPVGTPADVYALGVLLGEILTGQLLGAATTTRASAAVAAPDATRTLRGLPQPRALARQLRGDLDAIIATALAEEPDRRYRSAGALADDLERYLDGRAVHAHPPSRSYRIGKFAQRHRRSLGVASMLLLALLGALGVAIRQTEVARQAAAKATTQARRADAMRDFMFDAFAQAQPGTPKAETTVAEAVERGVATALADTTMEPRARIELLLRLADVLRARGKGDRAQAVLDDARTRAATDLPAGDPLRFELALGELGILKQRGQVAAARAASDRLLREVPAGDTGIRVLALANSAWIAGAEGDVERGERDGTAAVELARSLGDDGPLPDALGALGSARIDAGRGDAAVAPFDELLAIARARYGDSHVRVAEAEAALARAHRLAGHREEALAHARRAVAIGDAVYPPDHWARGLHRNALVMALIEQRAFDEALTVQREAMRVDLANRDDADPNLVMAWGTLAIILTNLQQWDEALAADAEALRLAVAQEPRSRLVARLRLNNGYLLAMTGRRAEGEAELEEVVAIATALGDAEFIGNARTQQSRVALNAGDLVLARERIAGIAATPAEIRAKPAWSGRVGIFRAELALASGDRDGARAALADAAREIAVASAPIDRVGETTYALLAAAVARATSAPDRNALEAAARARFAALPFPAPHVRRLATAAGVP